MIIEFTDINVIGHLIVFTMIIEKNVPLTIFLGLLKIKKFLGGKNALVIFYYLVNHLKIWELE